MNFRVFTLLALMASSVEISSTMTSQIKCPYAYINQFVPECGPRNWLSIIVRFNQTVDPVFLSEYLNFLGCSTLMPSNVSIMNRINQLGNGDVLFKQFASGRTRSFSSQNAFQALLNEANHYFDAHFKTPEQIAIEQAQKEEAAKAEEERKAKVIAEEKLQKITRIKLEPQKALLDAIRDNSADAVRQAVTAGAKVNFENDSKSPLLKAILLEKMNAIETLLECGSTPNVCYLGKPILHYVLQKNDIKIAVLLVKYGANFSDYMAQLLRSYLNSSDQTYIGLIGELICECIKHGYDFKSNINNPVLEKNIFWTSLNPLNESSLSFIFDNGANSNQIFYAADGSSWTPLLKIIDRFNPIYNPIEAACTTLLLAGADINQKAKPDVKCGQHSPLSYALVPDTNTFGFPLAKCTLNAIKHLITNGASLEKAIYLFIKNGGDPKLLVANKKHNPNYPRTSSQMCYLENTTPLLILAIDAENEKAVKFLLDAGADPNRAAVDFSWHIKQTKLGNCDLPRSITPILYALAMNNIKILKLLLEVGANPNQGFLNENKQYKPLSCALVNGNSEMIELLIKHGACV